MKLTQNKLSVILATVVAGVSILANCMTANAAEPMKTRLDNRYVLAGSVDEIATELRPSMLLMRTARNGCILMQAWKKPWQMVRM
jgi:hypothetical protein